MNYAIDDAYKTIQEHLNNYNNYSDLDKVKYADSINNAFDKLLNRRNFDFSNISAVKKIHDQIIQLESPITLISLDLMLLEYCCNEEYLLLLQNDIYKNISELVKKHLNIFVTDGLKYQLQINNIFDAVKNNLGNDILNNNCFLIILNIVRLIPYLEMKLKDISVNVDLMELVYKNFSPQELAFIYGQLNAFKEYNNSDWYFEYRERIYENLWKRSDEDKFIFMKTIIDLSYCNEAEGIYAMLVDLFSKYQYSKLYQILMSLYDIKDWYPDNFSDYFFTSQKIKELRDNDIKNGNKPDYIRRYASEVYYSRVKK